MGVVRSKLNDAGYSCRYSKKGLYRRRRRQADGVLKAKVQGKYKGRPEDLKLHNKIRSLLDVGKSYSQIQHLLGSSRHTISKVKKRGK